MSFVPNRKLLQYNFDGYKLAPKHLSFATKKLSTGVHVVHLKEQFSYQHVRTFSLHNHLFADPWSQNVVYWCSNDAIMAGEVYYIIIVVATCSEWNGLIVPFACVLQSPGRVKLLGFPYKFVGNFPRLDHWIN